MHSCLVRQCHDHTAQASLGAINHGGSYGVIKYLLNKQTHAVTKRNGDDKLPIQLLGEAEEDHQELLIAKVLNTQNRSALAVGLP